MAEPVASSSSVAFNLADIVVEIEREITVRRRVYPTWVRDGRLTRDKADRNVALLEAAAVLLRKREAGTAPAGSNNVPAITAQNWKPIGKSTLVGSADIIVVKWQTVFKGCCLHRKGDKQWIGLPARGWVDEAGARQFADVVGFTSPNTAARFRTAVLKALLELEAKERS